MSAIGKGRGRDYTTPPRSLTGNGDLGPAFKFGSPFPSAHSVMSSSEIRRSRHLSTSSSEDSGPKCDFCDRPPGQIFCHACGHFFRGRVRGRCSHHPEIIHLMDYEVCINCHSSTLREFAMATSPASSRPGTPSPGGPAARSARRTSVSSTSSWDGLH